MWYSLSRVLEFLVLKKINEYSDKMTGQYSDLRIALNQDLNIRKTKLRMIEQYCVGYFNNAKNFEKLSQRYFRVREKA